MNQALAINVLIIGVILTALILLKNPLVLLALMYLTPLPYGLQSPQNNDMPEDEPQPMGFTQDVK